MSRSGCLFWFAVAIETLVAPAAWAELRFAQTQVSAGILYTSKPFAHRFTFVNTGNQPVEIKDVRASCGCLQPLVSLRTCQPGEQGSVLVEVNTLSQSPGFHAWTVHLVCQEAGRISEIPLQVQAQLVTEVMVQPAAMVLIAGKTDGHEITVTDARRCPLSITGIKSSFVPLRHRLAGPTLDEHRRTTWKIALAVSDECPDGRYAERLVIQTSDPDYPDLSLPITIVKCAPQRLAATPSQVSLSRA
jgi:hypothetical protein